jgi:nucleotide-binding universal stress UspA family protein
MSRILVPIDHTEQSLQALRFAQAYAKDKHELTLLHVIPFSPSNQGMDQVGQQRLQDFVLKTAHAELEKIKELAEQSEVPYTLEIQFGDIHEVIADASKSGYEAIIMGTHGYGRFAGFLMQSVSYPTIHDASIPVFLISGDTKPDHFPWKKVLIAVDGSEQAKEAVEKVVALSQHLEVTYTLLTAVPLPLNYAGAFGPGWENPISLEEYGQATILPYEEMLKEKGCTFESKVLLGDPALSIKETAKEEGADLIVLGHHGLGGFAGTMMGSVTFKMIHRAQVPLLIVKK